jgi:hypothetical protein
MSELRPAPDASAAQWLLRAGVAWNDLVRYGPPGFATYLRILLQQETDDPAGEAPSLRTALGTLATHTTTPRYAYAAIWEGWIGSESAPLAPRVLIPHRTMLLFAGPVDVMRDAPSLAWFGEPGGYQEPHLVWPADQAWCLACEVDEEIEFSVGCSARTARALEAALPGAVRRVPYAEPAPMYRDET